MNKNESVEKSKQEMKPLLERKPMIYQGIVVLLSKDGEERYEDQRLIHAYQQGFRFIQIAGLDHVEDGRLDDSLSSGYWSDPVDKMARDTYGLYQFRNFEEDYSFYHKNKDNSRSRLLFGILRNEKPEPETMLHYNTNFWLDRNKSHAHLPNDLLGLLQKADDLAVNNKSQFNVMLNTSIGVKLYYSTVFANIRKEITPKAAQAISDLDNIVLEFRRK